MSGQPRVVLFLLVGVVSLYLALGALYAIQVPLWNAPDEPSHFNYVRHLAETRQLPVLQVGDYDQQYLEQLKSKRFPSHLPIDPIRYESHQPPLYYALATLVYAPLSSQPVEIRALGPRLFSVVLGALGILVAFSVASRVFPKDQTMSLGIVSLIAFIPMRVAIYSSINNDALGELLVSCTLLALIARWGEQRSRTHLVLLGLLVGLALLTKVTAYVVVLLVPLGLLLSEMRRLGEKHRVGVAQRLRAALRLTVFQSLLAGAVAATVSGWWFVRNAFVYGWPDIFGMATHDLVVTGQPLTGAVTPAVIKHFLLVSFRSFWGQFGWMGVLMDERVYLALALLTALSAFGVLVLFVGIVRGNSGVSRFQLEVMALLATTCILAFALAVGYNLKYLQPQGRYLFPAMVAIATLATVGLREMLSERHRGLLFALLCGALCVLDVVALYRFILPALVV